ncbi:hypothetical protein Psal027_03708 (plasmid) [Piscirickettsia salmonis]|nr:hypothetical protein [Piscirickettsia salmonis]ERL61759.1 hypothetical protein K661_01892 [Piscirickettsia salmonis LF-89 = ATCC VR-1361]QGN79397.1 hypothetical protein Psal001_03662 [Piscirickettsia salmonis]QGN82987.1 hypothetical protein Psal002_03687 [Piscirickettsia salmonis]QGN86501.1 hypothetical protein Psal003_03610 [Piscirickettsia salmonis]QGN90005.1 hypothetical protein Psal004_03600 [Piscirickettsia salmonis]
MKIRIDEVPKEKKEKHSLSDNKIIKDLEELKSLINKINFIANKIVKK